MRTKEHKYSTDYGKIMKQLVSKDMFTWKAAPCPERRLLNDEQ